MIALLAALVMQCPDGTPPPCARAATLAAPGANSVAVLLFANVARDSAAAYLGDGLASEIATSLAGVPRLEVRSPGLVRGAQRDGSADPRVLGRRLGVRYVVEGDYQRGGDRIRVSVRLVTVATGTQRWSNAYTRPASDLLSVQEDVAREVATSIAGQLLPQERSGLAAHPTRNPAAWDAFLRGNYDLARRTREGVSSAMESYAEAARLDPSFAGAEARIALGYALFLDWGWPHSLPAESLLALGLAAADRAIARDSASSDGWMSRAYLLSFKYPRDYTQAMPAFERSVALDPRNAEAWHQYASKLVELGDAERAMTAERHALDVDPGRAVSQMMIAKAWHMVSRLPESVHAYDSSLSINPAFYPSMVYRGEIELVRGNRDAACRDAESAARLTTPGDPWGIGLLAACRLAQGDTAAAASLFAAAESTLRGPGVHTTFAFTTVALAYVYAGRTDDAWRWIERAPRGAVLWSELLLPYFGSLRSDPRVQRLMQDIRPIGAVQ
jgi:adenylate cyclase